MNFIPKEQYNRILQVLPIACVDVAIISNRQLLVIRRGEFETYGGLWWIPGGRIYHGESWHSAVKRKALEETGLNVQIDRKIQSYEEPKAAGKHFITTLFVTSLVGNTDVKLDDTSSAYKWVSSIDIFWHPLLKQMICDAEIFDV